MGVQFLLGRAGTGKTRTCLEEIRAALRADPVGPSLVFLVPEQATFQMEYALANTPGLEGFARAQVLSFRRLAWKVFLEVGGAARPQLGELGKQMVLRAVIESHRERLRLFGRAAGRPGFIARLAGTLKELRSQLVSAADLDEQRRRLEAEDWKDGPGARGYPILAHKLHDLALLEAGFREQLRERFTDPDDTLSLAALRLAESSQFHHALVWIDGFAGFTPQEYELLSALMQKAARMKVALCLDPDRLDVRPEETDPFHPTLDTYGRLLDRARRHGVEVVPSVLLPAPGGSGTATPPRFARAPYLAHLEREFFCHPPQPRPGNPAGEVRLVAAGSRRAEVEAAARQVLGLARETGLRWREMAVIVRNLEAYADLVATTFADHDIPVFIDRRLPVAHHPLVELLRSLLEIFATGWAPEPVFRLLKTDLTPLERDAVDRLENYVLEHGIRGAAWLESAPWRYTRWYFLEEDQAPRPDEQRLASEMDRLRRRVAALLRPFASALARLAGDGEGLPVGRLTAALLEFLDRLRVADTLELWRGEAEAQGHQGTAQEHVQVWEGVTDLLDQLVEGLGDRWFTLKEYARILETGLESLRLGLIPPALDQVLVGSVERSRQPELRAALVLGAGDGVLPAAPPEDAIFTDQERDRLGEAGVELAATGRLRSFHEQFLTYIALTRSSEFLWVSYPLADDDGRALAPSPAITRLRQLFPGLVEETVGIDPPGPGGGGAEPGSDQWLEFLTTEGRTAGYLARQVSVARTTGRLARPWDEIYEFLIGVEGRHAPDPELTRDNLRRALAGLVYQNGSGDLEPGLAGNVFPAPYWTSVSRLEEFALCPFRHFAARGLGLVPRPEQQVEAAGLGRFMHAALRLFVEALEERGLEWARLTEAEVAGLMEGIADRLAPRLENEILLSTARYRHRLRLLKGTLARAAVVLGEHARRGAFRPLALELPFGGKMETSSLPSLSLGLGDGVVAELGGRIDRVDLVQAGDRRYLRVIDYKTTARPLRIDEVLYGLRVQLPAYLAVVLRKAGNLPGGGHQTTESVGAGILYFGVHVPPLSVDGPLDDDALARETFKAFRMHGLILNDPQVVRLMGGDPEGPQLLPVSFKQDGTFTARSAVVSPERLQLLLDFVVGRQLPGLARRILAGETAIAPCRHRRHSACRWCDFRPCCHFEPASGGAFRYLAALTDQEAWAELSRLNKEEPLREVDP